MDNRSGTFIVGYHDYASQWAFDHPDLPDPFASQSDAEAAAVDVSFKEESVLAVCEVINGSFDEEYAFKVLTVVIDGVRYIRAEADQATTPLRRFPEPDAEADEDELLRRYNAGYVLTYADNDLQEIYAEGYSDGFYSGVNSAGDYTDGNEAYEAGYRDGYKAREW